MAMADKNINYTDTQDDTVHDSVTGVSAHPGTEPATGHDVKEGGIIGAVGGAIVGALAGGPIGAVIGAVAGGAASAAAVDVVDKHDNDYARTVGGNDAAIGTAGTTDAYTNANYTGTTAASDPYATTGTTTSGYNSNLSQNTGTVGTTGEAVIPIVEEELEVGKRQVEAGGARIRTGVTETPVEQSVSLREEHVTVSRHAVNEPVTDAATAFKEQNFEVTETDEVPVIAKTARVVEEVVVGKTATERTETVHDTVRHTDVEVEDLTDGTTRR